MTKEEVTLEDKTNTMEAKEAECHEAEAKAADHEMAYKNSVTAYKNSKDRARDLMKRLGDEENNLKVSVEAWVDKYCEAQRRASSTRGDAIVRALWFSRSRRQACALIGERVEGFSETHFKSLVVWGLGEGSKLDTVISKNRVPVSSYEASEDDPRDAKPEGEDWNEVEMDHAKRY